MRYHEDVNLPSTDTLFNDGMLMGTAAYALVLGLGMVVVGLRARQRWVAFWGAGLFVASGAYLGALGLA